MFWLLTAWLVFVGLSSIIPQLFGHESGASTLPDAACLPTLQDLRHGLLERGAESVEHLGDETSHAHLNVWLAEFDAKLMALKPKCIGSSRKAWRELLRLRHGLSASLDRLESEQTARMHYLDTMFSGAPANAP